jgi:hypothetical protein
MHSRWHFFEFMDLPWLAGSLRAVLREILDAGNSKPFRAYYDFVSDRVLRVARHENVKGIYDMGAGTAPISRHMAPRLKAEHLPIKIHPCDINPDPILYRHFEKQSAGRIEAILSPVDFTSREPLPATAAKDSIVVFSANLHHLPQAEKVRVLKNLLPRCRGVVIAEPLRFSPSSFIFVLFSLVPALLLPLIHLTRPGRGRRIFWCWILPLAPPLFVWDGLVSAWREWSPAQRDRTLYEELGLNAGRIHHEQSLFSEFIYIRGEVGP